MSVTQRTSVSAIIGVVYHSPGNCIASSLFLSLFPLSLPLFFPSYSISPFSHLFRGARSRYRADRKSVVKPEAIMISLARARSLTHFASCLSPSSARARKRVKILIAHRYTYVLVSLGKVIGIDGGNVIFNEYTKLCFPE